MVNALFLFARSNSYKRSSLSNSRQEMSTLHGCVAYRVISSCLQSSNNLLLAVSSLRHITSVATNQPCEFSSPLMAFYSRAFVLTGEQLFGKFCVCTYEIFKHHRRHVSTEGGGCFNESLLFTRKAHPWCNPSGGFPSQNRNSTEGLFRLVNNPLFVGAALIRTPALSFPG